MSQPLVVSSVGGTTFSVKPQYKNLKVIGRGSYGVVISCTDVKTSDKVAIKRIKPMSAQNACAITHVTQKQTARS